MYIINISEYQVERGEERSTMMRVMGQSQVLEKNNMSTLIFSRPKVTLETMVVRTTVGLTMAVDLMEVTDGQANAVVVIICI